MGAGLTRLRFIGVVVAVAALVGGGDGWGSVVAAQGLRIVALTSHTAAPYDQALASFRQYFRQAGLDVTVEVHSLEGDGARMARIAQEVRRSRAIALLTLGTLATQAAIQSGLEIPIVAGLIVSPADIPRSANATGVSLEFPLEVQFQWLRRFLPAARTVGVLYSPDENQQRIAAAGQVAARLGLKLEAEEIRAPRDIPPALESLGRRVDVLWTVVDSQVLVPETAKEILLFSFRNRIPVVGLSVAWVRSGALYALEWDHGDMGLQCAEATLRILQGARAGAIPVAGPRKVHYVLNQRIATHLKLELPERLVRDAREVF